MSYIGFKIPPLRSLIRDTLTDGCCAELVHVFVGSSALSMSVQSYCTPGTHGVHGLHPHTIFVNGSSLEHDFREKATINPQIIDNLQSLLLLMWTLAGNDLQAEPNHLVLLVKRGTSLPMEISGNIEESSSSTASDVATSVDYASTVSCM